jgi:hypothetical protein
VLAVKDAKISYAGIAGAVGAIVALLGIYAGWYRYQGPGTDVTLDATVFWAGDLALWASIATFAFACAFILFSDTGIRRAMGALMTVSAVVLLFATLFGFLRLHTAIADAVAGGALPAIAGAVEGRAVGLYVTVLGAILAVGGGILTLAGDSGSDRSATVGDERREMDMK